VPYGVQVYVSQYLSQNLAQNQTLSGTDFE
jgi:hypothetical protein